MRGVLRARPRVIGWHARRLGEFARIKAGHIGSRRRGHRAVVQGQSVRDEDNCSFRVQLTLIPSSVARRGKNCCHSRPMEGLTEGRQDREAQHSDIRYGELLYLR